MTIIDSDKNKNHIKVDKYKLLALHGNLLQQDMYM